MRVIRDIFLGLLAGILMCTGLVLFVPQGKQMFESFVENTGIDVNHWLEDTKESYFTALFSDGQQIAEGDSLVEDVGYTGEAYSFSVQMNPYYEMLNETQQEFYKQMYANASEGIAVFTPNVEINVDELEDVYHAVFYDHPELFWLDTSFAYKYYEDGTAAEMTLHFNETAEQLETSKAVFEQQAEEILIGARAYENPLDQERYVHDRLLEMIVYDENAAMNQSAYSGIVNHATVCAGYAKSFQYLMQQLNIPTYYVVGTSENEEHAWNIIYLNGRYYNVDVTWDDTSGQDTMFFNLDDSQLSATHTRTGMSKNLPVCE